MVGKPSLSGLWKVRALSSRNERQAPVEPATPKKASACRRTKQPDCYRSKLAVEARDKNENSLIAAWVIVGERQDFLEQFIGKFLLFFKKREMAGIVKPDEFLMGSPDGLAVLPNQGRRAVRIVPPLKEQDWCFEVGPEFAEINFHHFGQQYIDGELGAMDPAVDIHRGIFWS